MTARTWENLHTGQQLTETGERHGEIVCMITAAGTPTTIHSDLLGNGEWRVTPIDPFCIDGAP